MFQERCGSSLNHYITDNENAIGDRMSLWRTLYFSDVLLDATRNTSYITFKVTISFFEIPSLQKKTLFLEIEETGVVVI